MSLDQQARQFEQMMPVGIIPVAVATSITQTPQGQAVMIVVHSPMGAHSFVMPPDIIENQLIPQLKAAALQARTGLQLGLHLP